MGHKEIAEDKVCTSFQAMRHAIINSQYIHQLEDLIDMYLASDFDDGDSKILILLFHKYLDKNAQVNTYHKVAILKEKLI
jgi:hypothetical protein